MFCAYTPVLEVLGRLSPIFFRNGLHRGSPWSERRRGEGFISNSPPSLGTLLRQPAGSRQNSPTRRILPGTSTLEPAQRKNRIMKLLNCALVVLALSGTGCGSQSSLSPQMLQVSGTVRYPDGTPVSRAKVWADADSSALWSDPAGRFVIVVPANGDSITLYAVDGYTPGVAYASISSGSVRIGGRPGRITLDIVLDRVTPI